MSDVVIRAEKISKRYRIGNNPAGYKTLRETLVGVMKAPFNRKTLKKTDTFWALKDVSFEVNRGEVLGLIGRNGAGKSTLLKILSRITKPTTGQVRIRGRVGSLLEVGTGFHSELSGRENIYLNGAILGMKRSDIDRRFDEIVSFAEIDKFLDTPVKFYSSGMYMRLAFSVAAHLEPEILLVDEVLAVGDVSFQKKCLGKMGDVAKSGRTVLFVSHNMAAIENLCDKAILLNSGNINRQGDSQQIINYYLQSIQSDIDNTALTDRNDRTGNGKIRLTSYHLEDMACNRISAARSGMDLALVFSFQCEKWEQVKNVDIGLSISTDHDQTLFVLYSSYLGLTFDSLPQIGAFRCIIPNLPLSSGRYRVGARVTVAGEEADWPQNGVGFLDVETGDFYRSGSEGFTGPAPFLIHGKWEVGER